MPRIAQYSRIYWFPNGTVASSVQARVFNLNTNTLATLYTDATGTVTASNPVTTTAGGVLSFFAAQGEYWVHLGEEAFRVSVGSPDLDLFEATGHSLSTGIAAGGHLSTNGTNPQAVDIAPLTGYIVDEITDPDIPAVTRVRSDGLTVALDAAALLRTVTWWLMTSAGAVLQQAATPTAEQRRTHLVLGATAYDSGSGVIFVDLSLPVIIPQQANQLADLMDALGPFSVSGNVITPNGVNLSVNQSAGTMFSRAFNHSPGPSPTRNPHVAATLAQSPGQFRYVTRSSLTFGPLVSVLDVANYDVGGVITPIGGGAGSATIQRVWISATAQAANQLTIQYGQTQYSSLSAAVAAIGTGAHVVNPLLPTNGTLIAYVAVTRTATDLSDPSQCAITLAGKFATP